MSTEPEVAVALATHTNGMFAIRHTVAIVLRSQIDGGTEFAFA